MSDLGLTKEAFELIRKVFADFYCVKRAVIFGSRAKGTYSDYSDVDIALYGTLNLLTAEQIACALEELPLVYKFDVIAFDDIKNDDLREHIARVGVEIYPKEI